MLMADVQLVTTALNALNFEPALVDEIVALLTDNSDSLDSQVVTAVGPGWFGGSTNGHRIGVNTQMAHQAVEEEFQKLADSLREYSAAITKWANEVQDIDAESGAVMTSHQAVVEQVNTTIIEARDESTSDDIGDGTYTDPATSGSGS
ncbi:hypothetical protein L2K70_14755 [Nocardioides KLBMP 9356]|uniref:WXG100 family type VII secretion target n=1 Tax=Nocardioides potassii TaxID=2911371 RepID=A0ABS9HFI9_9ACTN|nr:hypothetical protein [Nocardioides potassii]MCF6378873.1 hypothetical protein [Nocardioides potassii]